MADHKLHGRDVTEYGAWTFHCDVCDLPFMQSFGFHNEEYHNGNLTE